MTEDPKTKLKALMIYFGVIALLSVIMIVSYRTAWFITGYTIAGPAIIVMGYARALDTGYMGFFIVFPYLTLILIPTAKRLTTGKWTKTRIAVQILLLLPNLLSGLFTWFIQGIQG